MTTPNKSKILIDINTKKISEEFKKAVSQITSTEKLEDSALVKDILKLLENKQLLEKLLILAVSTSETLGKTTSNFNEGEMMEVLSFILYRMLILNFNPEWCSLLIGRLGDRLLTDHPEIFKNFVMSIEDIYKKSHKPNYIS